MKIIVLAGGLSTERDVSLSSSAGICKTLLAKGHDVFLLDVFLGFPYDRDNLEEVFTPTTALSPLESKLLETPSESPDTKA